MEVKPVKQTEKPNYPLKAELNEKELKKQIPERWMRSPAAKIALGTLAAVTLAGCAPEKLAGIVETVITPTEASVSVMPSYVPEDTYVPEGTPMPAKINVAPLFIHGEGRGESGGDKASAPAFISEDEALKIINEAAKEYGLEFSSGNGAEFYNVLQPVTDLNPDSGKDSAKGTKSPDKAINLKTDFADLGHGIVIEYVSADDVKEWAGPSGETAEEYDTKEAADQLCDALEQAVLLDYGFSAMGVLYDPCDFADSEAEARALSKEDLKAQAKDFFEWLKAQGVI